MKKHGNLKDDSSGVDLTPLLDVVFIMLIFLLSPPHL
jgi:outer membrane transport energization protein ExbD (TC 2.C.1.1.1)